VLGGSDPPPRGVHFLLGGSDPPPLASPTFLDWRPPLEARGRSPYAPGVAKVSSPSQTKCHDVNFVVDTFTHYGTIAGLLSGYCVSSQAARCYQARQHAQRWFKTRGGHGRERRTRRTRAARRRGVAWAGRRARAGRTWVRGRNELKYRRITKVDSTAVR
jgi:hypothetical protein